MKKNNNIQMPNHPFKTAQDVKRYVRDILLQVQQEETLKKIIDMQSSIILMMMRHLPDFTNCVRKKDGRSVGRRMEGAMELGTRR